MKRFTSMTIDPVSAFLLLLNVIVIAGLVAIYRLICDGIRALVGWRSW